MKEEKMESNKNKSINPEKKTKGILKVQKRNINEKMIKKKTGRRISSKKQLIQIEGK